MQEVTFDWSGLRLSQRELGSATKKLDGALKSMRAARSKGYETPYASLNLPDDQAMLRRVKKLAREHKGVKALVIVGIGGSNLGTMAVQQALQGRLSNELGGTKVYWLDTVDSDAYRDVLAALPERGVLVNVVSKSGGTTESVANFELFLKHRPDARVVVTTDEDSKLWRFAERNGYDRLPIPRLVGGRYSVLSPVGLFPLAVLGVDIGRLVKGAAAMRSRCLRRDGPAAKSAAAHYLHDRKGRTIANTFLFSTSLEGIGKWYRQLMGESIGKEHDTKGRRVNKGVTPTVAIGSTDLHSMAQLYLGGPDDKFTTIVTLEQKGLKLPVKKEFDALVPDLQGKALDEIMDAIVGGVLAAYRKSRRPYCTVNLSRRTPEAVGAFLQFKMVEMMLLGSLFGVDPFDQPAVERYKKETKRLLAR